MNKYVVDGLFLTQRITGIQRYAFELIQELDRIIEKDSVEILVPAETNITIKLENIPIIKFGRHKGILWQQFDYPRYLIKFKAYALCLTNILPLMYPKGFIAIHDVNYKANPQFFRGMRDKLSMMWHRLNYFTAAKSRMDIITVSEFSKTEIMKYYHVNNSKIHVIYNAWQHMKKDDMEITLSERFPDLKSNSYFFAMATLAPNKNFQWILAAARNHQDKEFVIAGGGKLRVETNNVGFKNLKNLHLLGYVSDEDARLLMRECYAFVFPTLYEGFGIPPLEAVACGATRIIVSDTPCMHEIYEDAAYYINPDDYSEKALQIDFNAEKEPRKLLVKYSWKKSAEKLKEILFCE